MMKDKLVYGFEILLSAAVVGGLLFVAFYYKPAVHIDPVKPSPFGYRNAYYGVSLPGEADRIIWAVGSQGRVIRSDDGGGNWTIQETPTTWYLQDIAAWDPQTALAVGDRGVILRTEDGGVTWNRVPVELHEWAQQLLQVHVEPDTDRAWITGTYGTVLRSDDRGRSWQRVHPEEDLAWNDVVRAPDGTMWIVGEFGRMKRSTDDGASWEEVSAGADVSLMAIAFADADRGVVVGLSGTVLRTADGGASWQPAESGIEEHLFDVTWDGARYVAVGDRGRVVTAGRTAGDWRARPLAQSYFNWHTKVRAAGGARHYLAGADLGVLRGEDWRVFTRQHTGDRG